MKQNITDRVTALRQWMKEKKLAAYVFTSTDPHAGEYIPDHWQCRQWISGFEGSAGTAVVTLSDAALWTDSRYFIAAAEALEGTPFQLMKEGQEGTPSITGWLAKNLKAGDTVGIDGDLVTCQAAKDLQDELLEHRIYLSGEASAANDLWTVGRPPMPLAMVKIQPMQWAGETVASKVARLMDAVEAKGCASIFISQLDEVAWLLNLRGDDVHCNPVFVSYCLVSRKETALFCFPEKISDEVMKYLADNNVSLYPYEAAIAGLAKAEGPVLLSPLTNVSLASIRLNDFMTFDDTDLGYLVEDSPIAAMKAVKNDAEIRGMKQAMLQDGVALVKWLRWLEEAVPQGGETELSIDRKLTSLRQAYADFEGLSFDTISAYQAHGAIVHYEPTPDTDSPLKAEGILLVDTGAQYTCGTTDITRTMLLGGTPTPEQKKVYTLVLKGHIALSRLKFPRGACGTQLDLAARYAMWQEGYNFGHGTGHGVGAHLNVHEGPHQIRMNHMPAPIVEGMTVTDEPGLYLEGRFGVRTENVLLCVPFTDTEFGRFVGFEPLTLCPIDTRLIDTAMMTPVETSWLNAYHQTVLSALLPHLDDPADRAWLQQACAPL